MIVTGGKKSAQTRNYQLYANSLNGREDQISDFQNKEISKLLINWTQFYDWKSQEATVWCEVIRERERERKQLKRVREIAWYISY